MKRFALLVVLVLAACSPTPPPPAPSYPPAPSPSGLPSALPTGPVPAYLLNPAVTQATIGATICVSGWTAMIRPPSTYTSALKARQLATSGAADQNTADYEEDHWIPLELGGAPRDERNLWPELWPDARTKDVQETALKRDVCAGAKSLDAARLAMYRWRGSA